MKIHTKTTQFLAFFAFLVAGIFFSACWRDPVELYDGPGKKPIYQAFSELSDIKSLPPRGIQETGTIFLLDSLFFLLEYKKGIHVFRLQDSLPTEALAFWQIPAATDFSIAGNRLYVDSWRDLVTIDISNIQNIREVGRNKGVFQPILYPILYNGPFECVDENQGVLIGWEDAELIGARCRTIN